MGNSQIYAAITSVGGYVPPYELTNQDLEGMVETSDEWIYTRTGIKTRRIMKDPDKASSHLALSAAKDLLSKKPDLKVEEIDMVIVCTSTPDHTIGPTAALVATALGAVNAVGYDLNAACSGFLYGLSVATAQIQSGNYKKVLLIGAEKMSTLLDYTDRVTCILFGDGAGAVLFEPTEEPLGVKDQYLRSDGSGIEHLNIKAGGSRYPISVERINNKEQYIRQDGPKVFKHAVTSISAAATEIINRNQLDITNTWFLCHQANKRIIQSVGEKLKLPEDKVLINIDRYGNTNAATLPLLLYDFEKKFKKGDDLVFASFGAGFTWGAIHLKWAY